MKAGAVAYISDLTNQDHILRIVKINIIIIINAEGNLLVAKTFSLYFFHADMFFPILNHACSPIIQSFQDQRYYVYTLYACFRLSNPTSLHRRSKISYNQRGHCPTARLA